MSFGTRILLSLFAGLMVGMVVAALDNPSFDRLAVFAEPIGTLWLNALRMTVIPLVIGLLITGVASASETASSGRLAMRSLLWFAALLAGGAILGALLVPAVLAAFPVDPDAAAALRAGASGAEAQVPKLPPVREWFINIVPTNPFQAAAEGAMLPLVVFALLFGFAAAGIRAELRATLLGFFQAVVDTMFVLVHWVLWLAPIGVFALAFGVGTRGGFDAAGALGYYLVLMCSLCILITIVMYPVAVLVGRVPLPRFARAVAPVQVVAFSTQSSLASLPAMLEAAQGPLLVPTRVAATVLPLAVSLFRITSPIVNVSLVTFVAHVYGVPLDAARLSAGVLVAIITSFAIVGLPGQSNLFVTTVPISLAMGVPMELLPLLLAVEVIPDIFRTVGNVTADLTVTVIAARDEDKER
jgi:proton glutamate symport protein